MKGGPRGPNKEGHFAKMTKQAKMPNVNQKMVPINQWNWKENDPEFYEQFHRMPDSKDT